MKITIVISIILSLCAISFLVYGNAIVNSAVYAQSDLQTVKNRNLVIDLGNGVKTNAQLTYPANGKGPFPAVLLVSGTGANNMNETLGLIRIDNKTGSKIYPAAQPFWQISQYLSERGFAVLRYDKRGIGANYTILNSNVWGNLTANGLVQDAEKALTVLVQQPEIDPNNITLLGHSEGTIIAPRVAIDNPTKAKNVILMGAIAQTESELLKFQVVQLPILYAEKVLDYDHDGLISIQQIAKNPVLNQLLVPSSIIITSFLTNDTKVISDALLDKFSNNTIGADNISIDKQLKPELVKIFESFFVVTPGKK